MTDGLGMWLGCSVQSSVLCLHGSTAGCRLWPTDFLLPFLVRSVPGVGRGPCAWAWDINLPLLFLKVPTSFSGRRMNKDQSIILWEPQRPLSQTASSGRVGPNNCWPTATSHKSSGDLSLRKTSPETQSCSTFWAALLPGANGMSFQNAQHFCLSSRRLLCVWA